MIQFIIKMSANDWFRQRMGNSNDGWNVVKPKQHKKQSKPTSGTYIPPGKRIESTNSSWELKQKLQSETHLEKKEFNVPTADDFPSLTTEKIVPRAQSKWGANMEKVKKAEPKELPQGWYNLASGNYPRGPLMQTYKYGPPQFKTGFPDDPDAEWRQKYADMYPDDTDCPEPDFSSDTEEIDESYDDQQDNTKEIKYSGRRARKNRHTEDEEFY